ncbi:MAG: translocation/assembly module TamB domain-containing protein [Gemmatimonadaceae bacterium]
MSRRRMVAIVSACVMLGIGLALAAVAISITQTGFGRERVRKFLLGRVAAGMQGRGSMYIGRISGSFLTGVVVDSFAIRDEEDSLFLSSGPVRVTYDPRDLIDKRLLVKHIRIERPVVNIRRHADGSWNYKRVFPSGPPGAKRTERKFGDYIVIDSAEVIEGRLALTMPWAPPDSLTGARRDSAVRVALASWRCGADFSRDSAWLAEPCGHDVRRTSEGLKRTYRWRLRQVMFGYARIADPDSVGRLFAISDADVDEPDPPFAFRNIAGPIRWVGDTIRLDLRHWDLPGSTGSASGTLLTGPGPIRYDLAVVGDSVSLADVNWVYPTLPKSGGGKMKLHIASNAVNRSILEFTLADMDVRSTGSHLRGAMTFAVGGPVLVVKDVNLRMEPVDFALIRTLSGKPLPVDWAGQITGTVRGRGGPLNRFQVDDARFAFRDAHVPGAVTRGSARGGLDILAPALTKFRGFDLDLETLDLRTIRFLYPNFARLGGTVSGRAVLDSSWLDVRFSRADLALTDGSDPPSRFTGSGRITIADEIRYDVDLQAAPISFTALARSYPIIPFRGTYAGPLRVRGALDSLFIETSLAGPAGGIAYSGYVDGDSIYGYAAHGTARVANLDVRTLIGRPDLIPTALNAELPLDIRFDSLANMVGTIGADVARSTVDSLRIFPSTARFAFGGGRMRVDSLRIETTPALLTARGAIGLTAASPDTLRYAVRVDSLGGLRRFLLPDGPRGGAKELDSAATSADSLAAAVSDSLAGTLTVAGMLIGSLDTLGTLATTGDLAGADLFVAGNGARRAGGTFTASSLLGSPRGRGSIALDSLLVAGVRLATAGATLDMEDAAHGRLSGRAESTTGPRLATALRFTLGADSTRLTVDTLVALVGFHRWALAAPANLEFDSAGFAMDSLVLRNGMGGSIALAGALPGDRPLDLSLSIRALPLEDVGIVTQATRPVGGTGDFSLRATGTRAAPVLATNVALAGLRYGTIHAPDMTARAAYADRKLDATLDLTRGGRTVLTVTGLFPVNLALGPVENRLLDEPLRARVFADTVDFALVELLAPDFVQRVDGTMSTDVAIGGTWRRPTMSGRFAVDNGDVTLPRLGIRARQLRADIGLARDSIRIFRLSAVSGERNGRIDLDSSAIALPTGSLTDIQKLGFNLTLRARNFQAVRQRRLADLELSGRLTLNGPFAAARLGGAMTIERGALYVQEQARKQLVALDDPDFLQVVDTTVVSNRRLVALPSVVDDLIRNLTMDNVSIDLGDEVWLRSPEANVKLGGTVDVTTSGRQLALAGNLLANRGEYRLDLGVVQRRFDVTQGSITFYGEPGMNPALDITAVHTVRQANRQDVRIRVNIGGTLQNMRVTLSSDERIAISTTEILSYLVFGVPTFALGQQGASALRPVFSALLPTAGVFLERQIVDQIGFFDLVQIQAGTIGDQGLTTREGAQSLLSGSRIGLGKQLGERTFLTANAGLCGLAGKAGNNVTFSQSLGLTLEHQLRRNFSAQLGVEPAATALLCNRGTVDINTPRQLGFDLFREWSF